MPAVPNRRAARVGLVALTALVTLSFTAAQPAAGDADLVPASVPAGAGVVEPAPLPFDETTPRDISGASPRELTRSRPGAPEVLPSAVTTLPIAVSAVGNMVVDTTRSRIYMSGGDRIIVTDLAGAVQQTLMGFTGARSMVLEGNRLYVLGSSTVVAVDVAGTPTVGATLATGLVAPWDLAYAADALFTTAGGPCVASTATGVNALVRIDVNGGGTSTYGGDLNALRCPTIDGWGNEIVIGDTAPMATLRRYDVQSSPSMLASASVPGVTAVHDVHIDPVGAHVVVSYGIYRPAETRTLNNFTPFATYKAMPSEVAQVTDARGGMTVLGGFFEPNVVVYLRNELGPKWTLTVADLVVDVAFSADGSSVFAYVLDAATGMKLVIIDVDDLTLPGATQDGEFHPLDPARVFDSRASQQRVTNTNVRMTGLGGVPAANVSAVAVNITVTGAESEGYVSVYPSGTPQPNASTLNFRAGQNVPNMAIVGVGADGSLSVFASAPAHVIVDVVGWFGDAGAPSGSVFHAFSPTRWFDTRTMKRTDGTTRPVLGRQGISVSFWKFSAPVTAAALNVTATNTTSESYLTVMPYNSPVVPSSSNLNWMAGDVVPNAVISRVDQQYGAMMFLNAFGSTDVIADATGYWDDGSAYAGARFHPVAPTRLADTRTGYLAPGSLTQSATRIDAGGFIAFKANGGLPAGATSAVLNVTAVTPAAPGYLSVYPSGLDPVKGSQTSLVNFFPGDVRPNMTIMAIGAGGEIVVVNNSAGPIDVLVDITGYFA